MARNSLTSIYKDHHSRFLKDLHAAKGLDETQLHRVRVEIKNLRVLLDLLGVLSKKKYKARPMLKQLEPLFKSAGSIRSVTLNLKLSQPYKSAVLVKFRQHLKDKQHGAGQKFLHEIKSFETKKFSKLHKKALAAFRELKPKKISKGAEEYMRVQFAHVRAGIFDIGDDSVLHQIRKRIKSIRNIGSLLEEIKAEHPFKEELKKVNVTYDKIGHWHDTIELVDHLEEYVDKLGDPAALEKTAPLIIALKKKCLYNKRQIERKLKADLVM
jgi:CHAD domain-containing protein